jgi:hypothetical protein
VPDGHDGAERVTEERDLLEPERVRQQVDVPREGVE